MNRFSSPRIKMPNIVITQDKFDYIRSHMHNKRNRRVVRKGLTTREIYLRKKIARLNRANGIKDSEEIKQFFDWIWAIQTNLKLSNKRFAERAGVSLQTLKLWRNSHGHYPSDKSYRMLLKLDRESNITKEELKVIFGERISCDVSDQKMG